MSRKMLEDVRPPEKRSIRSIPVSAARKPSAKHTSEREEREEPKRETRKHDEPEERVERKSVSRKKSTDSNDKGPHYILWSIVGVCVVVLFFAFSAFFAGATVTISPKHEKIAIDEVIPLKKDGAENELEYQVVTISKEASKTVAAQGEQNVEKKASGRIVIFNNATTASQRLIKNTRFETPEGLIYRINESVVVPGKTAGKPGSLEVTVYADAPGAEYNIGLNDFTIPGFKTDALRYKEIFARSKTPMTGGAKGITKVVKEEDVKAARQELQTQLRTELSKEVRSQIPDQFIAYESGIVTHFESLPNGAEGDKAVIKEKGTINAIIINKLALSTYLAKKELTSYNSKEPVEILGIERLVFGLKDAEQNIWQKDTINATFKGEGTLVWLYSQDKFKQTVRGRPSKEIPQVLGSFPAIEKADVVLSPFWKTAFPENTNKIKVINKI